MKKTRHVGPHVRNGRPVSGYHAGYTPQQSWSQKCGAIIAGHQKGNVKLAVLGSITLGLGSAAFALMHVMLTTAEIVVLLASVGAALLGLGVTFKHVRRRWRKRPVTLSLQRRKHHTLAKLRKARPSSVYRSTRTRLRKRFPGATGVYDRWFAMHEVTIVTGKGKKRAASTHRMRGLVNRETFLAQEKERDRQSGATRKFSHRQVFR